jgi:hypothetical protein
MIPLKNIKDIKLNIIDKCIMSERIYSLFHANRLFNNLPLKNLMKFGLLLKFPVKIFILYITSEISEYVYTHIDIVDYRRISSDKLQLLCIVNSKYYILGIEQIRIEIINKLVFMGYTNTYINKSNIFVHTTTKKCRNEGNNIKHFDCLTNFKEIITSNISLI